MPNYFSFILPPSSFIRRPVAILGGNPQNPGLRCRPRTVATVSSETTSIASVAVYVWIVGFSQASSDLENCVYLWWICQMHIMLSARLHNQNILKKMCLSWLWVDVSFTRGARMHTCQPVGILQILQKIWRLKLNDAWGSGAHNSWHREGWIIGDSTDYSGRALVHLDWAPMLSEWTPMRWSVVTLRNRYS
jgi:hypothetical protein